MEGALGKKGHSRNEVFDLLAQQKARNTPSYGSRMFRPSYFAGEDIVEIAERAFAEFIKENWLYGRTTYAALGQFEDDVLATLYELFHAPDTVGGVLTSGGTESLILSVKIARDHAREREIPSEPYNIVLPHTSHPAFDKAADLLCLEVRRAPESKDYLADTSWMDSACDDRTVMIVGSAPPYPFGQTDPIEALSELAQKRSIWLHVDACLGGMISPFLRDVGEAEPAFDFRIPGVDSISVDLHKFGYASKGISALVLRNHAHEAYARTIFTDWPAGLYATPGISGTRSGGALASAWAVMKYLGHQGFIERTAKIIGIRNEFISGLQALGGQILGRPDGFHFNFEIQGIDSLVLTEELSEEGWVISCTENPDSVQLMITAAHEGVAPEFCRDVKNISEDIRTGRRKGTGKGAVYSKVALK